MKDRLLAADALLNMAVLAVNEARTNLRAAPLPVREAAEALWKHAILVRESVAEVIQDAEA